VSVIQRQSWVWAVLPETAERVDSHGDPALAEVLRDSGYELAGPNGAGVDAVLYDTEEVPGPAEVAGAAAELADGGVVSIAVAGGRVAPPRPVPAVVRVAQLVVSPLATLRALAGARRAERALRQAGLASTRLATGDRSRSRYGLGRGGWVRRLRTPVGFVLTGSRGPQPASLLESAIARAQGEAGLELRRLSTTVFESGKVVVLLRARSGEEFFMRLGAGPAEGPLRASLVAVEAVAGAGAPAPVRERLVVPLASGSVGPLRYSLEPNASGSHPWRLTDELWDECLKFLSELFRVEAGEAVPAGRSFAEQAARMHDYLDAGRRAALPGIVERLDARLAHVPRGFGHGDFWSENLLVRDGRVASVLDWEWSARRALPLLDLFDLIALSRRRVRDFTPGERLTEVLLPLVREGRSERVHEYCRALGLPDDRGTLEALAVAYWLNRVSRQLVPLSVFPQRQGWSERNLHEPLERLAGLGW
jgi:hypothetical protein